MIEKAKALANIFLGKTTKIRFYRILMLVSIIILAQCISCGVKDGKFWFEWKPFAEITIEK